MIKHNLEQHLFATATGTPWQKIGVKNHHGIVVPLFALHSRHSSGIGEYPDLIPLIDWCKENHLDLIQLLPLNDTGQETSPYSALSAYALNPLHLGLSQLPDISQNSELLSLIHEAQALNEYQLVHYQEVQKIKERFFRLYYRQQAASLRTDPSYRTFKETHRSWLQDYARFKTLKIRQNWLSWELWPQSYENAAGLTENPPSNLAEEMEFHQFLQYLCFLQLEEVKQIAEKKKIFIKGDIPILINRESADVWSHREFFLLQLSAGAPPDMYAKEGQKWGFPPYNWEAIANQGYRWWIERLSAASHFYNLYRLDHVVGFFRIWAIPFSKPAKEGHFIPEDKALWIPQGEKIMRIMLEHSSMLPIGEDLGTVPPEVRVCLRHLGICGTKVMRWERRWDIDQQFIDPKDYPPESMTTVSTHDSETLQQWWKNQPEEARLFAETFGEVYAPELTPALRLAILHLSHHSGSLFHINLLQEYLALIPGMTWPNLEDERINIPGTISSRNWSYRFRPSVEEIVTNGRLSHAFADILKS